jgi:hypothetical protein
MVYHGKMTTDEDHSHSALGDYVIYSQLATRWRFGLTGLPHEDPAIVVFPRVSSSKNLIVFSFVPEDVP